MLDSVQLSDLACILVIFSTISIWLQPLAHNVDFCKISPDLIFWESKNLNSSRNYDFIIILNPLQNILIKIYWLAVDDVKISWEDFITA